VEPLRIAITTADEPIVVNDFIRAIIEARRAQVVGLGFIDRRASYSRVLAARAQKGTASAVAPGRARPPAGAATRLLQSLGGLLSVLLIYGIRPSAGQALRLLGFRLRMAASRLGVSRHSPSIAAVAERLGIPVLRAPAINDPALAARLRALRPDVIINQAPGIVRADFLAIPRLGVLNRHNSLLPRNRGRLSTFWAIHRGEPRTGVSVHFVTTAIDAGPIIAQREVDIGPRESVNSLAQRCYALAPQVMLEALDRLERGETGFKPNSDAEATYNSNPTLREALRFRSRRLRSILRAPRGRR